MTPVQADANLKSVTVKLRKISNGKIKFGVGDNVRISIHTSVYLRKFIYLIGLQKYSKIIRINNTLPVTYNYKIIQEADFRLFLFRRNT